MEQNRPTVEQVGLGVISSITGLVEFANRAEAEIKRLNKELAKFQKPKKPIKK